MQLLYVIFFCTFVTCKTAGTLPTIPEETLLPRLDIDEDSLAAIMIEQQQQQALIIIQSVQLRLHNPITKDEIIKLKKQLSTIKLLRLTNDFLKTLWNEAASALDTRFCPALETKPIGRESYYTLPPTYDVAMAQLQQHPTAPHIPPPLLPPLVPMYSSLICPLCRAKRSDESALRAHIQVSHPKHC